MPGDPNQPTAMPSKTPRPASIAVNHPRMLAASRPTAYAVATGYLALHGMLASAFDMPPVKLLLYLTVATAAVQRVMRGDILPADLQDARPLPTEFVGFISRRALAAATGLPRETVRRVVNEMLADGLLILGPGGRLAAQTGMLAQPRVQQVVREMARELGAITDRLLLLGVFEVRT